MESDEREASSMRNIRRCCSDLVRMSVGDTVVWGITQQVIASGSRMHDRVRELEDEVGRLESHIEEADAQRDARAEQIEAVHDALGCEGEWTNLHDLGACAAEQVSSLVAEATRLRAEVERLRAVAEAAIAFVVAEGPCDEADEGECYCDVDDCLYCGLAQATDALEALNREEVRDGE